VSFVNLIAFELITAPGPVQALNAGDRALGTYPFRKATGHLSKNAAQFSLTEYVLISPYLLSSSTCGPEKRDMPFFLSNKTCSCRILRQGKQTIGLAEKVILSQHPREEH
jgi:hypothetical protein